MSKRPARPVYDREYVESISLAVYRSGFTQEEIEKIESDPKRGPKWFEANARAYDRLTRKYLDAINAIGLKQRAVKEDAS